MNTEYLEEVIKSLIETQREDDYWDFKREPHKNNASLLHDIICLANSLHKGDRYLIIGVSDPSDGAKIVGLEQSQVNRMKQSHLIDFLRNKKFAGEVRPVIELHTLKIENKEVDVLIISDIPNKPYYLIEDYHEKGQNEKDKVVKAYHIYTRVGDTNTPMDKSADIGFVEKMWKQRFGLDLSPLEKMKQLLCEPPERWKKEINDKRRAYYIESPEFHIDFSRPLKMKKPEAYCLFYRSEYGDSGIAKFKYHSTTLFDLNYVRCDETRMMLPAPENGYIQSSEREGFIYYYYNLDSLSGYFLHFLADESSSFDSFDSRDVQAPFICFENECERREFENYISHNMAKINALHPSLHAQEVDKKLDKMKFSPSINAVFAEKICQEFQKWKHLLI